MDYILSTIQNEIRLQKELGDIRATIELYRIQIEYACTFLLAYLWNKNLASCSPTTRETIFATIAQPTIGQLVSICRQLDREREFFHHGRATKALNAYPTSRNRYTGHGFVSEDAKSSTAAEFERLATSILGADFFQQQFDLVLVRDHSTQYYTGVRFPVEGGTQHPWRVVAGQFAPREVYATLRRPTGHYFRLSPFVLIERNGATPEFAVFRRVADRLAARVEYNRLLGSGNITREWPELVGDVTLDDDPRRKSSNSTILNRYQKNHKTYIDCGPLKQAIKDFLHKNRASVCATIWGHGGVGKTATVQSICEDLSRQQQRSFDYIIFASAKDRHYDHTRGEILAIEEPVNSYHGLLNCIGATLGFAGDIEKEIREFSGRLLLVIDDYETFGHSEKDRIRNLIGSLNTQHHKVLLTTRANVTIGERYETDELSEEDTVFFLREVMQSEFPGYGIEDLEDEKLKAGVHATTDGRPVFIFALAHIWAQVGGLQHAILEDVKSKEAATEFLYGRIYEYLTDEGRVLFMGISRIVKEADLSNLVSKLRFIVSMESDQAKFDREWTN